MDDAVIFQLQCSNSCFIKGWYTAHVAITLLSTEQLYFDSKSAAE